MRVPSPLIAIKAVRRLEWHHPTMTGLILSYSRTGTTRRLANALAGRMGAEQGEIKCPRYDGGWWRYLLAGYDSVRGNLPPIDIPAGLEKGCGAYDLVLLGGPVWTSHPALPLRAFLAGTPSLPARIGLFLTHGGHSAPEKAMAELAALLPFPPTATLAMTGGEIGTSRPSGAMDKFIDRLIAHPPTSPADLKGDS